MEGRFELTQPNKKISARTLRVMARIAATSIKYVGAITTIRGIAQSLKLWG
jgi:hypothetical protein